MNKTYRLVVDGRWEYDLDPAEISGLDLVPTAENTYHILEKGRPFTASIRESDFDDKRYCIRVNSNNYEVRIEDDLDKLIGEMGFASGSAKSVASVEAPMPGLILEINVSVGQEVREDDPLLILEAMKMENVISSPRDGVIKAISVSQGDAVEKKNILVEFE